MLLTLENSRFRVEADSLGAELTSIYDKTADREYLWQGDPALWPHRAPVLFPWCGPLAGGDIRKDGKNFPGEPEGFSHSMKHKLVCQDSSLICFRLESGPETRELYPWEFTVKTTYALKENRISSRFKVVNYSNETMYFRCGFLTALNLPFIPGTRLEDYVLSMEEPGALTILERDREGLLTGESRMWEPERGEIPASEKALEEGLLFKEPPTRYLQLTSAATGEFVRLHLREASWAAARTIRAGERGLMVLGALYGAPDSRNSPSSPDKKGDIIALGAMEEYYAHQTIEIGAV